MVFDNTRFLKTSKKLERTLDVTICSSLKKSGLKNGFTRNLKSANQSNKTHLNAFKPIFSLREEFCVEQMKYCCSDKTKFGSRCEKSCPTNKKGEICSNQGRCVGGGDKMGAGICQCETGNFRKKMRNFLNLDFFEIMKDTREVFATSARETIS